MPNRAWIPALVAFALVGCGDGSDGDGGTTSGTNGGTTSGTNGGTTGGGMPDLAPPTPYIVMVTPDEIVGGPILQVDSASVYAEDVVQAVTTLFKIPLVATSLDTPEDPLNDGRTIIYEQGQVNGFDDYVQPGNFSLESDGSLDWIQASQNGQNSNPMISAVWLSPGQMTPKGARQDVSNDGDVLGTPTALYVLISGFAEKYLKPDLTFAGRTATGATFAAWGVQNDVVYLMTQEAAGGLALSTVSFDLNTGGAVTPLSMLPGEGLASQRLQFAADAAFVETISANGMYSIVRFPLNGSEPVALPVGTGASFVVDAKNVYFTSTDKMIDTGKLLRVPISFDAATTPEVLLAGLNFPGNIAANDSTLVWFERKALGPSDTTIGGSGHVLMAWAKP